ncbi:hypothetical protein CLG94_08930 [Candidatus Methylomirabilis limnetica]|uniref:Lipoprotein n=2 Tax=Candidatus Methylomirabilis limnetica TaxID=2033718 RepID=A0A2T4TXK9_9BACT|nr:hypothetical protein CLG94_08930 [Candidatus Methylomirabilis limnetica]
MTVGLPGLLLALLLVGCAGPQRLAAPAPGGDPGHPAAPALNEPLRERVIQYWEARMRGDLLATYQLHEPAFRRAVTFAAFSQGRGATPTLAYEILDERVEGDMAFVLVTKQSTVKHQQLIKPVQPRWTESEEQWIRVEGAWYRRFRFPMGNPYPPIDWDAMTAERQRATDGEARP